MPVQLPGALSYCVVDGRVIFLDVSEDRYFRLSAAMESTFFACVAGDRRDEARLAPLRRIGVLPAVRHIISHHPGSSDDPSLASAIESGHEFPTPPLRVLAEVILLVALIRWRLRFRPLSAVLAAAADERSVRVTRNGRRDDDATGQRIRVAAAQFDAARAFAPWPRVCLLDSLALTAFLARRGLDSRIVMGVTCDPFEAHCWVQSRDLLINETVGDAIMYTPIRMI